MDRPKFDDYLAFVQVAEHAGYTAAARAVGLPASALSRRVARLESVLGAPLLRRSTRQVELTEQGRLVFQQCSGALQQIESVPEKIQQATAMPSGLLRVGVPQGISLVMVQSIFGPFLQRYPTVNLQLVFRTPAEAQIGEGTDLFVCHGRPETDQFEAKQVLEYATGLYAASGYLDMRGAPREPEHLSQHDFLAYVHDRAGRCNLTLRKGVGKLCSVSLQPRVAAQSFLFLRQLALDGAGIAVLPSFFATPWIEVGLLERVLDAWKGPTFDLWVGWRADMEPLPKTQALVDFVVSRAEVLQNIAAHVSIRVDSV